MDKLHTALGEVFQHWADLTDDAAVVADEYRDRGYETTVLHPGDVTTLTDDPFGIDVMVPDDEFAELESVYERAAFDTYEVYRRETDETTFLLVVIEDSETEHVVLYPAYYNTFSGESLRERAVETGTMYTHVRRLDDARRLTFDHDEPELFFG